MKKFRIWMGGLLGAGLLLGAGCRQLSAPEPTAEQLAPSRIFSSHMVLQRERPIVIFGGAEPGGTVRVSLDGRGQLVTTGPDGRWRAEFPARPAGGPLTLEISGRNQTERYDDVMVGDVWFCSGQSNMEMSVSGVRNAAEEIAAADHPGLRIMTVEKDATPIALDEPLRVRQWERVSPETLRGFSATAYFFGRDLQQKLNIPIGLIHSSWSGSPIETWLPLTGADQATPQERAAVEQYRRDCEQYVTGRRAALKRLFELEREVNQPDLAALAAPDADSSGLRDVEIPCQWEKTILPGLDGMVEFRRELTLPASWAGRELELELGAIDEVDRTYFNGVEIARRGNSETGETGYWRRPRFYRVPGKLVRPGRNVITVFVSDLAGEGGLWGQAPMRINPLNDPDAAIALEGTWQYQVVVRVPEAPKLQGQSRTVAYNAMVVPFFPFPIKGAIWYQGESNAANAARYRQQLPQMIADWRKNWGEDFPFYLVQLANFTNQRRAEPRSEWAELREAQRLTAETVPGTGMAVIIDIGEANDIHPKNKQDVGHRLALQALAKTYGFKDLVCAGPEFDRAEFRGAQAVVHFKPAASPLRPAAPLLGFELAGKDGKFHPAQAEIVGDTVIVTAPEVPAPTAVRYAWANNPECNLFNQAGLPASPFTSGKIFPEP